MNIQDRIEQAPACEVINLTEAEKDIYSGAGWNLARFVDGRLIDFFNPADVEYREDVHAMVAEALENAIAWIATHTQGEIWLGMCSCYQFCEPRRIILTDAVAIAHMARVFAEQMERL